MLRRATGFLLLTGALVLCGGSAQANRYLGDLVYCDVDANGIFDGDDYGIDGVDVDVVCSFADGTVCADFVATTGSLHPSVDTPAFPTAFPDHCGETATFDPFDPTDLVGRYLVNWASTELGSCSTPLPLFCTIEVDESTLPDDCAHLVTPLVGGAPLDTNDDGDLCDLGLDGPFAEGQALGNQPSARGCEAWAEELPGDALFVVTIDPVEDRCSLGHDFGYTGESKPDCPKTCHCDDDSDSDSDHDGGKKKRSGGDDLKKWSSYFFGYVGMKGGDDDERCDCRDESDSDSDGYFYKKKSSSLHDRYDKKDSSDSDSDGYHDDKGDDRCTVHDDADSDRGGDKGKDDADSDRDGGKWKGTKKHDTGSRFDRKR